MQKSGIPDSWVNSNNKPYHFFLNILLKTITLYNYKEQVYFKYSKTLLKQALTWAIVCVEEVIEK